MKTDVLIIGSGIAGFTMAIKLAKAFPEKTVTIITKKNFLDSNTNLAQGGIAVVIKEDKDSFEKHISDTFSAGDGLGDKEVIERVVREAPGRLRELQEWGIFFDRTSAGEPDLAREGGHSASRIVHYKDTTGNHVAEALFRQVKTLPNVQLLSHHLAVDLITKRNSGTGTRTCIGAVVLDCMENRLKTYASCITVIATGGLGQVYQTTTNPVVATGDGIAMAWRAGASVADMEFIQFHPTALYSENDNPAFLISEAVRGFGGYLRSGNGERFVLRYDSRGELACRDVVSKAIHQELLRQQTSAVFLDCTHLPAEELGAHFPAIYEKCLSRGYDLSRTLVPVAPAAHYLCGGIVTDIDGKTSITNLYACGECARTGLHGANRLASNSLLEALVFAHQAFLDISSTLPQMQSPRNIAHQRLSVVARPRPDWVNEKRRELRSLMARCAGIVRTDSLLRSGLRDVVTTASQADELYSVSYPTEDLAELRNMLQVSRLILEHSLARKDNRGTYYNLDKAT